MAKKLLKVKDLLSMIEKEKEFYESSKHDIPFEELPVDVDVSLNDKRLNKKGNEYNVESGDLYTAEVMEFSGKKVFSINGKEKKFE